MTDKTPQILPRKPGEPGEEKALALARKIREVVGIHHLSPEVSDRIISKVVAGALAACALAERKVAQDHIDALEAMLAVYRLGDMRNGAAKADKVSKTREKWLERAAEGKA